MWESKKLDYSKDNTMLQQYNMEHKWVQDSAMCELHCISFRTATNTAVYYINANNHSGAQAQSNYWRNCSWPIAVVLPNNNTPRCVERRVDTPVDIMLSILLITSGFLGYKIRFKCTNVFSSTPTEQSTKNIHSFLNCKQIYEKPISCNMTNISRINSASKVIIACWMYDYDCSFASVRCSNGKFCKTSSNSGLKKTNILGNYHFLYCLQNDSFL